MKERDITELVTPVLVAHGLELDQLEIMPAGKRRLLRVTVDGDGRDGRGPDLDDIAAATKAVSAALDDSPAVGNAAYTLEVSSRGVGRPLTRPAHWRRNRGRLVEVGDADGTRFTARITAADDDGVDLETDEGTRRHAWSELSGKALVQIEFNRKTEPAPGPEEEQ